ncbi:hypothetical protein MKX03_032137 [Papaver bracteatum]|nr:hypothetical protein MKX03_032137 [Papaver bracteatum]
MAQGNSYEEARKQRLEDNKRRFEEFGVLKISNNLQDVNKKEKKNQSKVKSKATPINPDLVRRSSRPRNQVTYSETNRCEPSYMAKRVAIKDARADALKRAMSFQSGLLTRNPSFVKSMSPLEVAGDFRLNIPSLISNKLPKEAEVKIVLEDEGGSLYETHCDGTITYPELRAGWGTFSRDHNLDDGDALVIELIEPTRWKIHIFKMSNDVGEVKVDQPKKARYAKTVDAEQITKPTGTKSCNSEKAEKPKKCLAGESSSQDTTEPYVQHEIAGDLHTAVEPITEL